MIGGKGGGGLQREIGRKTPPDDGGGSKPIDGGAPTRNGPCLFLNADLVEEKPARDTRPLNRLTFDYSRSAFFLRFASRKMRRKTKKRDGETPGKIPRAKIYKLNQKPISFNATRGGGKGGERGRNFFALNFRLKKGAFRARSSFLRRLRSISSLNPDQIFDF